MAYKPMLCPHGVLGVNKCMDCRRAVHKRYHARKRARLGPPRLANPPQLCPHGVLGITKCRECRSEYDRAYALRFPEKVKAKNARQVERDRQRRKAESRPRRHGGGFRPQLCPHGVLGRTTCIECVRAKQRATKARAYAKDPARVIAASKARREANLPHYRERAYLRNIEKKLQPGAAFDPTVTHRALIAKVGTACHYCSKPTAQYGIDAYARPDYPTIDHVYPVSLGGGHTWANVVLACRQCNSEKQDDVCKACGGPITEIGLTICAKCAVKERFAVCRQCGYVEMSSGHCDRCHAKGPGIWLADNLTRKAAYAMSRSLGFEPKGLAPTKPKYLTWDEGAA